jgi:hypothetical protein
MSVISGHRNMSAYDPEPYYQGRRRRMDEACRYALEQAVDAPNAVVMAAWLRNADVYADMVGDR